MTPTDSAAPIAPASATVSDLLERRSQVQSWLARLDDLADGVAPRVAERVRADYEERLRQVMTELTEHRDGIHADILRLREELEATSSLHDGAVDQLDEARLRHLIGELAQEEWDARRPALEQEVTDAADAREQVARELTRMEELLHQIDDAPDRRIHIEELAILPGAELETEPVDVQDLAEPATDEPDAEFLQELDRALASDPVEDPSLVLTEAELDVRPKPGIKCPDCGYTNDPNAWYCGVCGVDLN